MKEKNNRIYQKPDLINICPPGYLKRRMTPTQALTQNAYLYEDDQEINKQHEPNHQSDHFIVTTSEWHQAQTITIKNQSQKMSKTQHGTQSLKIRKKNSVFRGVVKKNSPYVKDQKAFNRLLSNLKPVKGPTESILTQINKHNSLNKTAAQNVIMKKKQSFSIKINKYSNRIGLKNNQKIFIFNSKDFHIREILQNNNWVESLEKKSAFFHLKWVYLDNPADYDNLKQGQLYNHFKGNQELTNKNMLRKNIKNYLGLKPNFPMTYDLELRDEEFEFRRKYEQFVMFSLMKEICEKFMHENMPYYERVTRNKYNFYDDSKKVRSVLSHLEDITRIMEIMQPKSSLLQKAEIVQEIRKELYSFCYGFIQAIKIRSKFNFKAPLSTKLQRIKKMQFASPMTIAQILRSDPFIAVQFIKIYLYSNQFHHHHYGLENAWIIKPTGVSRGSGISIQKDITKISTNKYGKIVQKYIERPLLLGDGKKFDIRQWVLVKSFYPLQAYVYENCYCRISFEEYEDKKFKNLNIHLTNFTINKSLYKRTNQAQQSIISESCLQERIGEKWTKIKRNMHSQILKTLKCCQLEITQMPQCFEIYGFDIILDEDYRPWILEVNMSPACEERADFLKEYLSRMSQGVLDIINGENIRNWVKLEDSLIDEQLHFQRINSAKRIANWWKNKKK